MLSRYVIQGDCKDDETNEYLYWSNDEGWTTKPFATVFTKEEIDELDLPLGWTNIEKLR